MDGHSAFFTDVNATTLPWTESPFFEQLLGNTPLEPDEEQALRFYAKNGYLVIDPQISEPSLDGAITDLAPRPESRVQDAWTMSQHVRDIATSATVMRMLALLYRRQPIPFQTLNFNVGTEQATHSDTIHFHSVPERFMCGVWVALEDIDAYNGPLHYYPGSHKLPAIEMHHLGIQGTAEKPDTYADYPRYVEFLRALIESHQLQKIDVTLKKGQALIWAANLLHGGSPILDRGRTRHSQVTHYYFENCLYYTPLLSDLPIGRAHARQVCNIATGQLVSQSYHGTPVNNAGQWPPVLATDAPPAPLLPEPMPAEPTEELAEPVVQPELVSVTAGRQRSWLGSAKTRIVRAK